MRKRGLSDVDDVVEDRMLESTVYWGNYWVLSGEVLPEFAGEFRILE